MASVSDTNTPTKTYKTSGLLSTEARAQLCIFCAKAIKDNRNRVKLIKSHKKGKSNALEVIEQFLGITLCGTRLVSDIICQSCLSAVRNCVKKIKTLKERSELAQKQLTSREIGKTFLKDF
jgi:hypothetical protein